jgi:hypothetical protein
LLEQIQQPVNSHIADEADLRRLLANDFFLYTAFAAKRGIGGLRSFVAIALCLPNSRTLEKRK